MDKDSVILKYLQKEMEDREEEVADLSRSNTANEEKLNQLESKLDEVYALLNLEKKPKLSTVSSDSSPSAGFIEPAVPAAPSVPVIPTVSTYEELFQKASSDLIRRGLDVESLDYHSLVTDTELAEIEKELNRPLPRREKWEKGDFVAVFIAASIGSLVDFILSDRNNKFTGKGSDFSDWLIKFHEHEGGGPIDYQGPGFGGPYHRGLSKGHDILRFVEGILMFKNGQFEGIRYIDGVAHKVVSTVTPKGNPYEQLGLIEAILKYTQHMFADLFSTCSLPFPGSSFLVECGNRDLRKLAATMYQNGFNIKNIMVQSLSTIIVETILRVYFGIKSVQKYKDSFEVSEDYSNFGAIKEFIKPSAQEKLQEMLLLSHSIVTAMNIGKVVIKKSPWEINITEIISVVRYAIPVLKGVTMRHSEYAKLLRNSQEIHANWEKLAQRISLEEAEKEFMTDILVIQ